MNQCKDCSADRAPGRSRCYPCYGAKRRAKAAPHPAGMKILYLDIETTPMEALVWGSWQQNVYIDQIINPQRTMCFSAMWQGGPNQFFAEWQDGGHEGMVEAAYELLNEADAVVHYYGSQFDIPHLNTEFLKAGLTPPSPYKQIDLKFAVSKNFKLPSNKLQYVSTLFGTDGKDKMEMDDWKGCMAGDKKSQKKMEKYNRKDVDLLDELYQRLLPWVKQLPNRNLYDGAGCAACGSVRVRADGLYYTALSEYNRYYCNDCGYWMRASKRNGGVILQGAVL